MDSPSSDRSSDGRSWACASLAREFLSRREISKQNLRLGRETTGRSGGSFFFCMRCNNKEARHTDSLYKKLRQHNYDQPNNLPPRGCSTMPFTEWAMPNYTIYLSTGDALTTQHVVVRPFRRDVSCAQSRQQRGAVEQKREQWQAEVETHLTTAAHATRHARAVVSNFT